MSEQREAFEAQFPVPERVYWDSEHGKYRASSKGKFKGIDKAADQNNRFDGWRAALSHAEGEANWRKWWKPDVCPITRAPFFMWIEHPDDGWVPTYGGPYDSYTIPVFDGESYTRQRYDHDEGGWIVGEVEDVGVQIVDDQLYVTDQDPSHPAPQVAVPEGYAVVPVEPTNEMQEAGGRAIRFDTTTMNKLWTGNKVYAAMLAAAPTAPAGDIPQVTAYDHSIPVTATSSDDEQPVSDPDGSPETRGYWVKDSGYGIDVQFDTLEEALSAASSLIEEYRIKAGAAEWPSDAGSITISTVTHVAKFVHVRENEFDLRMEAVAPAPGEREIAARALKDAAEAAKKEADETASPDNALALSFCIGFCRSRADRLRAGKEGE